MADVQALIIFQGIDVPQASRAQVGDMRAAIAQLSRDPRVREIYGTTGHSTGCAVLMQAPDLQEINRAVALAQVSGLTNVEVVPLLSAQQLQAGLEEAEKIAEETGPGQEAWTS